MYGKVFESMYDGTLRGHWQAIVTMQQLIVLANEDGVVDMTAVAIADRTCIPLDIITAGLEHLAKPDPFTRTPGEDGRRIVLLDDHRPWGWRLVNHAKYRALRNLEQKREADRVRLAEKRAAEKAAEKALRDKGVATGSQGVANVAHADTDADAKAEKTKPVAPSASPSTPSAGRNGHDLIEDPVVERIPLNDGTEYPVTKSIVAELERLYPAVDAIQTLREIRGWNIAEKSKRKTRAGVMRHIFKWFGREQDKAGRVPH
jgi:hypothetical protein